MGVLSASEAPASHHCCILSVELSVLGTEPRKQRGVLLAQGDATQPSELGLAPRSNLCFESSYGNDLQANKEGSKFVRVSDRGDLPCCRGIHAGCLLGAGLHLDSCCPLVCGIWAPVPCVHGRDLSLGSSWLCWEEVGRWGESSWPALPSLGPGCCSRSLPAASTWWG